MRTLLLSLVLALTAMGGPPRAVPLDVSGDTVRIIRKFPIVITAAKGGDDYNWVYPSSFEATEEGNVLTVTAAPKGTHKVKVRVLFIDYEKKKTTSDRGEVVVVVGDVTPGPGPGPTPPDPTPIPEGPMRVLIIFESADLSDATKTTEEQRTGILRSLKFQNMLTDRTDKNGPNKRGWNIWEKDQKGVELADKFWQDAFARPHPKTPYIHIFKGDKIVHEGELPKTVKEATDLINRYAGS